MLCVDNLLTLVYASRANTKIGRVFVADSAAGTPENRYCGFRLEKAERVAKAAPLVERLPGACGSESDTFKATLVLGMARCCPPKAITLCHP
jgi:hypothetical protein